MFENKTLAVGQGVIMVPEPDEFTKMLVSIGMLSPEDYVASAPTAPGRIVAVQDPQQGLYRVDICDTTGKHAEYTAQLIGEGASEIPEGFEVAPEALEFARDIYNGEVQPLVGQLTRAPEPVGLAELADLDFDPEDDDVDPHID